MIFRNASIRRNFIANTTGLCGLFKLGNTEASLAVQFVDSTIWGENFSHPIQRFRGIGAVLPGLRA
jgi:hypothetical protein